jgi:hypothetical protein
VTPAEAAGAGEPQSLRAFREAAASVGGHRENFAEYRTHLARLMGSPFAADWITRQVRGLATDAAHTAAPGYAPGLLGVARTARWSLCLRFTEAHEPPPELLWGAAEDFVVGVPRQSPNSLHLLVYRRPQAAERREGATPGPLLPSSQEVIRPGEAAAFSPEEHVVVFAPQPAPVVSALLTASPRLAVRWSWQQETLLPDHPVASDPTAARLMSMIPALAATGHDEALPVLRALAEHPAYFVRWQAVRAAYALDPTSGRGLLDRAVRDPHPQVAEAAQAAVLSLSTEPEAARSSPPPSPAGHAP